MKILSIARALSASAVCLLSGCASVPDPTITTVSPVVIARTAASYPLAALSACASGFTQIRFDVNEYGTVENAVVIDAQPSDVFNAAAIRAIRAWRFEPGRENGVPARATLTQKIDFAAPPSCLPFDTNAPGNDAFDEDQARNACYATGANQWGYAELHFLVGSNGVPTDVRVHRSTAQDLSEKARDALAREQFEPGMSGQTLSRVLEFCSQ